MPSECFERDVFAPPEGTEKIRYWAAGKAAGDLLEEGRRDYSYLLRHHMVHSEAYHHVTGVAAPEKLAERGCQQRIAETSGGPFPERDGRLPRSVPAQCQGIALIQGVHEVLAGRALHAQQDHLGPVITIGGDPGEVGLHGSA